MNIKKFINHCYNCHVKAVSNAIHELNRYECLYGQTETLYYDGLKFAVAWEELKLEFFKSLPYVHKIIKTN